MKRIAVDLAKSVYQVAESVRAGQVSTAQAAESSGVSSIYTGADRAGRVADGGMWHGTLLGALSPSRWAIG